MVNKCIALVIIYLVALSARAAPEEPASNFIDRAGIKAASLADQMKGINPFQTDCLSLLKPANKFINTAETFKTKKENVFQLRLTGKIDRRVKVGFATDFITYKNEQGTERNYNFKLTQIPIVVAANGEFAVSLAVRKGQVFVPFAFQMDLRQLYELGLKITEEGRIQEAVFKPIIGPETRTQLCQRSRMELGGGYNLLMFDQSSANLGSALKTSSLLSGALYARTVWTRDLDKDHSLTFTSLPGQVKGAVQFQGDVDLNQMTLSYHYQKRKLSWNGTWKTLFLQPYVRYGGEYKSLPVLAFKKADLLEAEPFQIFNAAGGAGVNIMNDDDWMIEIGADVQYPLHASVPIQSPIMLSGSMGFYSTFNRKYYYGFVWSGELLQFSYSRDGGSLDLQGSVSQMSSRMLLSFGYLF